LETIINYVRKKDEESNISHSQASLKWDGKMNDVQECWEILPKVSRSFALCIRVLPKPLNEQMMLSYLIYRIIDTIEDSGAPLGTKRALFDEFLSVLRPAKMDAARVHSCKRGLCGKIDYTYEKELMENADAVVRAYYAQPKEVRAYILKRGRTMARGMYDFQKKKIETFADQNNYSYYVAGVIGYLFTDLLHYNGIITDELRRKLRKYARQFGLALQKVNILRDIAHDIRENRRYWPQKLIAKYNLSYESLCLKENREAAMKVLAKQVENARAYLESAMKYVLLLPKKALRVRMFCLIPLFMAIESYVKCAQCDIFDPAQKVKITKEQVQDIVAKSGLWGTSNERLAAWFSKSMAKVASGSGFEQEYALVFSGKAV